jgi:hypothetical protein
MERLRDLALVMAGELGPALDFDDASAAKAELDLLAQVPGVRSAVVMQADGGAPTTVAAWGSAPRCAPADPPELDAALEVERHGDTVCASAPVRGSQRVLGRIFLELGPARGHGPSGPALPDRRMP